MPVRDALQVLLGDLRVTRPRVPVDVVDLLAGLLAEDAAATVAVHDGSPDFRRRYAPATPTTGRPPGGPEDPAEVGHRMRAVLSETQGPSQGRSRVQTEGVRAQARRRNE